MRIHLNHFLAPPPSPNLWMLVEGLILHPFPIYIVFLRDLIGAKALNSTCTDRSKFGSDLSSEY